MHQEREQDLQSINKYHRNIQRFFYLSIPGAVWFLEQLTIGQLGEKFANAFKYNVHLQPAETIPLAIAVALWGIPFEVSEHNMAKMKQSIRDYRIRSGDMVLPVRYTPVDYIVNATMKILFEKSPLPK